MCELMEHILYFYQIRIYLICSSIILTDLLQEDIECICMKINMISHSVSLWFAEDEASTPVKKWPPDDNNAWPSQPNNDLEAKTSPSNQWPSQGEPSNDGPSIEQPSPAPPPSPVGEDWPTSDGNNIIPRNLIPEPPYESCTSGESN